MRKWFYVDAVEIKTLSCSVRATNSDRIGRENIRGMEYVVG